MVIIICHLGKYDQDGCKNVCPFDILYKKKIKKNQTFYLSKRIESGVKSHYEINVFFPKHVWNNYLPRSIKYFLQHPLSKIR